MCSVGFGTPPTVLPEQLKKMLHSESAFRVSLLQDIVKVMRVFSDPSAQVLITALILVEYLTLGLC